VYWVQAKPTWSQNGMTYTNKMAHALYRPCILHTPHSCKISFTAAFIASAYKNACYQLEPHARLCKRNWFSFYFVFSVFYIQFNIYCYWVSCVVFPVYWGCNLLSSLCLLKIFEPVLKNWRQMTWTVMPNWSAALNLKNSSKAVWTYVRSLR
jgi:hypothetical protein